MDKEPIQDAWEKYAEHHDLDITFQELDDAFNIIIHFEEKHFFPNDIDKHIIYKISNVFSSWLSWSHKRLLPPKNLFISSEADVLENRKEDLNKIADTFQAQVAKISVVNLSNSSEERAKVIQNSLETWREIKPLLVEMQKKIRDYWQKEKEKH